MDSALQSVRTNTAVPYTPKTRPQTCKNMTREGKYTAQCDPYLEFCGWIRANGPDRQAQGQIERLNAWYLARSSSSTPGI